MIKAIFTTPFAVNEEGDDVVARILEQPLEIGQSIFDPFTHLQPLHNEICQSKERHRNRGCAQLYEQPDPLRRS